MAMAELDKFVIIPHVEFHSFYCCIWKGVGLGVRERGKGRGGKVREVFLLCVDVSGDSSAVEKEERVRGGEERGPGLFYVHVCVYIYMHIYVNIYVCVCVYTYVLGRACFGR